MFRFTFDGIVSICHQAGSFPVTLVLLVYSWLVGLFVNGTAEMQFASTFGVVHSV